MTMPRSHSHKRSSSPANRSWVERLLFATLTVVCALISHAAAPGSEDRLMASSAALTVAELINPSLRAQGFVRDGLSWYRYEKESILVVNVQQASYAPRAYINLGIYYHRYGDEDKPDIVKCHLDARLNGVLSQEEALREIRLLDLTNDIPDEVRRDELQTIIRLYGVPFLERFASFEAARVVLSHNPKLMHVAPAARADLMPPSASPRK